MLTEGLYADFFNLTERPFTLVPDPSLLYWSPQHLRAMTVLRFGLMSRSPITLISGEIGAGKTTLLQALLAEMDQDLTVGLVSNVTGGRNELLHWIINAFGIKAAEDQTSYVQLFQLFQDFLVTEYANGRRVVIIIDEAQNLSDESLEEVRMLTNINSKKDELLQLVLVGQPELRDMVRRPHMRQMAQRVAASFHLTRLDTSQSHDYVRHRLQAVGGSGDEITPDAIDLIYKHTNGIPRLINQLCDFVMMYAWSDGISSADVEHVKTVIADGVFFGDVEAEQIK